MHAVIVANGILESSTRLSELWRSADLRIAADGGAANARAHLALAPHVLIGDMDSIDESTRAWCASARVETIQHPRAKNETDLELALDLACQRGATAITLLAVLGGRFDQTLANVLLLAKPAARHISSRIAATNMDAWIAWGHADIQGHAGETVSLIPITEQVDGIVTQGLKYPLSAETLYLGKARGVSNELVGERAEISFERGLLLVVHLFVA